VNRSSLPRFLLLAAIWGSSYTFIKVSLNGLTESQLVLARIALGALVLLAVIGIRRIALPPVGRVWAHMIVPAALGFVLPFLLLALGEHSTSAAMAGVLTAALPLITLAAATFLLPAERATWRKVGGLLIGFGGIMLVFSPWHSHGGLLMGQLAVIGATVCYAGQAVYQSRFLSSQGITPLAMAGCQLIVATLLQAAVTPLMPWHRPSFSWQVGASILVLGVVGTGIGYVLYFRLIADLGATTASSVNYLVPVAALVISVTTLHDPLTWNMLAGVVVVLLGLALAENRLPAPGARRREPAPRPEPEPALVPNPRAEAGRQ
jgi:drug/metabolite transporter (DMT)-like permease